MPLYSRRISCQGLTPSPSGSGLIDCLVEENFLAYNLSTKIGKTMTEAKMPEELILDQIEIGPMANYAYFIGDKDANTIAVVDPGWEIERLNYLIKEKGYRVACVLLTHGHYDHIDGLNEFLDVFDVPVYLSKADMEFFDIRLNRIIPTVDGQKIKIANVELQCILCPGHTPGCQSFYYLPVDKTTSPVLLTGDVLFIGACGRCDLPGSDPGAMYDTLYYKLMALPDNALIFPGHAYGRLSFDTLGNQKRKNPYLTCQSKDEFLNERMG